MPPKRGGSMHNEASLPKKMKYAILNNGYTEENQQKIWG
jgi:hypothetical protein